MWYNKLNILLSFKLLQGGNMDSENLEPKIRHLEMIQNIINRMTHNSFALKGWTITLISGILILSEKNSNLLFFLLAYIPTIMFWGLDSYYLQIERKYRILYKRSALENVKDINFDLTKPESNYSQKTCYLQSLFSPTELWFYFPTALLIVIVIILSILIGGK